MLALGLTACGGSGSPGSDADGSVTRGVLVDDRVVDAVVFCDRNGDGTLDDGETSTRTDTRGEFVFSPACAAPLASVAGTGYDLTLLKAPKARWRAPAGSTVVSPFTTLWMDSGLHLAEFQDLLARLGLPGVDPRRFDPTQEATLAGPAAALGKVLHEVVEVAQSAGADPQVAFQGALAALVEHARAARAGDLLRDDAALGDLIEAVATRAFASVDPAVWSETARRHAAVIVRDGLTEVVRRVRVQGSYEAAQDDLNSGGIPAIVSETDLEDAGQVREARLRSRGDEARRAQYVHADGLRFTPAGPSARELDFTRAQLETGLDLRGSTLGTLQRLQLPLRATPLALPRHGLRVALGLQLEQDDGSQLLQLALDPVRLVRDAASGTVQARLDPRAKLFVYARSPDGAELGSGPAGFGDLDDALIIRTTEGLAIDLQVLRQQLQARLPAARERLGRLLEARGIFKLRLVVGELDLRHGDASRFGIGRVAVRLPGDEARSAYRVNGPAWVGEVTF